MPVFSCRCSLGSLIIFEAVGNNAVKTSFSQHWVSTSDPMQSIFPHCLSLKLWIMHQQSWQWQDGSSNLSLFMLSWKPSCNKNGFILVKCNDLSDWGNCPRKNSRSLVSFKRSISLKWELSIQVSHCWCNIHISFAKLLFIQTSLNTLILCSNNIWVTYVSWRNSF